MKTFTRIQLALASASVALALALPAFAADEEKEVDLKDCPAAVQKTIKDAAADGKVIEVERIVRKDGSVIFEADIKRTDGRKVEVQVAEDGTLLKKSDAEDDDDDDAKD